MKYFLLGLAMLAVILGGCSRNDDPTVVGDNSHTGEMDAARLTAIAAAGRADEETAEWLLNNHIEWVLTYLRSGGPMGMMKSAEATLSMHPRLSWCTSEAYINADKDQPYTLNSACYLAHNHHCDAQTHSCFPDTAFSYYLGDDSLSVESWPALTNCTSCGGSGTSILVLAAIEGEHYAGYPILYRSIAYHHSVPAVTSGVVETVDTDYWSGYTKEVRYHKYPCGKARVRWSGGGGTQTFRFHSWYDYTNDCLVTLSDIPGLAAEHKNGVPLDTLAMFANVYNKGSVCDTTVIYCP